MPHIEVVAGEVALPSNVIFVESMATLWQGVMQGGVHSKGPQQPEVVLKITSSNRCTKPLKRMKGKQVVITVIIMLILNKFNECNKHLKLARFLDLMRFLSGIRLVSPLQG